MRSLDWSRRGPLLRWARTAVSSASLAASARSCLLIRPGTTNLFTHTKVYKYVFVCVYAYVRGCFRVDAAQQHDCVCVCVCVCVPHMCANGFVPALPLAGRDLAKPSTRCFSRARRCLCALPTWIPTPVACAHRSAYAHARPSPFLCVGAFLSFISCVRATRRRPPCTRSCSCPRAGASALPLSLCAVMHWSP
jgi:hypothetical protein